VRAVPLVSARAPWHCFDSRKASQKMTLEDGTPLSAAIGIGAFAEVCLVAAGQAVKVDPAARPEAAGLVGCGIMAGFGAIVNTAQVGRGDTVAVFGCGGVGGAAIHAAALIGARKVIAVDIDRRKLDLARQLGATDTVDSSQVNPVDAIRELTGGFGADVTVEAVGHPDVSSRPSTPATTPAPWSRWACPTRRCASTSACWTSTAAADRCGRPGTATACPAATSRY
jgi:Zn-dependent alcohol dehydrogenase